MNGRLLFLALNRSVATVRDLVAIGWNSDIGFR
jgi:hypothetical protein